MLHDMRNSMKAIPTRQEVKEDLVEQRKNLSPIWLTAGTSTVAEMEKSASERMDSSRVPQDTANLMLEKVRPLLNVGASQTTVKVRRTESPHS